MSGPTVGWTVGADGRRYPTRVEPDGTVVTGSPRSSAELAELAELMNSGEVAREIDRLVDDPELSV
jgi:hypothetical protein